MRKVFELLALPLIRNDPRIGGYVGNRVAAGDEFVIRQPLVEHAVQAVRLLGVALDRVRRCQVAATQQGMQVGAVDDGSHELFRREVDIRRVPQHE